MLGHRARTDSTVVVRKVIRALYISGTEDFNEFELGWVQRLKQSLPIDELHGEKTYHLTFAINKNKPASVAKPKKTTLDGLIKSYGLSKRR